MEMAYNGIPNGYAKNVFSPKQAQFIHWNKSFKRHFEFAYNIYVQKITHYFVGNLLSNC